MHFLVGYNGSKAAKSALSLARDHAKQFNAKVSVLVSMEGGPTETIEEITQATTDIDYAKEFIEQAGIQCEAHQLARGLTPAEDLVMFAEENDVDQIFVGIEKKSKTRKLLLGSTAQYVILKAPCPVVTIK